MTADWQRLFPDSDHRFQMLLRPGDAEAFWQLSPSSPSVLAERRHWLATAPHLYLDSLPEAEPAITEAIQFMANAAGIPPLFSDARQAAEGLEPDWVVLSGEESASFPVWGGAVAFPSSWSLREKLGLPLFAVHAPVPGLQQNLGRSIQTFLSRLTPGAAWERMNWGLSASSELNQHPARKLPAISSAATLDTTWLRLERQFLTRLPGAGALLFGIRVTTLPLNEMARQPDAAAGLARALATLSTEVAQYKGLSTGRDSLIRLLREFA